MGTDRESGFAHADAHADAGRLEEAIAEYRSALAAQPGDVAAHTRLGLILRSSGDLDGAIESLNTALQLAPDADVARLNLALALDEAGDSSGALAFIEAAGDLIASSPRARWMASRILLRAGDFAGGFAMHEARWDAGDASMRMRPYGKPRWRGEPAPGARLLIWHEQGLGDTLLALRPAATVRARGLAVVAHVQAPLAALARAYAGVEAVFDSEPPESAFDLHIPALSLHHALALDVQAAGGGLPALTPPPMTPAPPMKAPGASDLRQPLAGRDYYFAAAQIVDPEKKDDKPVTITVVGGRLIIQSDDAKALEVLAALARYYTIKPTDPNAENLFKVIPLKYVSAEDAARELTEIFNGYSKSLCISKNDISAEFSRRSN